MFKLVSREQTMVKMWAPKWFSNSKLAWPLQKLPMFNKLTERKTDEKMCPKWWNLFSKREDSLSIKWLTCWDFIWVRSDDSDTLNMWDLCRTCAPRTDWEAEQESRQHVPGLSRDALKRPRTPFENNHRWWDVGLQVWPTNHATVILV
jgi:hypothetical protein